ncbi:archaellin/type IV pilin N-terminal domain-containing protein [Pseudoflavonifractor sp. An184]|uniref:Flp family type IVb pilin n=1 Tax=Pseudoflavonifractor sp. An184 TaxID=1965576 RepID=UPI000B388C98|nr:archaellin/type IV pilin N-terminal domain-containing protein [Pseudoflavonifractor sp. An184]OUP52253.1 hypothetical protein B5F19_13415 [Pseudoflavonifractor sp. An184]
MWSKLNHLSIAAYTRAASLVQDLKDDERGLSGVVVAVLLILIAVLAIAALWTALGGWLQEQWTVITGQTFEKPTLK